MNKENNMITEPIHKTRILPLRWFANLCNHIGSPHLLKLFDLDEIGLKNGLRWKYHKFMWEWTWAIYSKWGTTHLVISWDLKEEIDKEDD